MKTWKEPPELRLPKSASDVMSPPEDRRAQYRELVKREMERAEVLYNTGEKKPSAAVLMRIDGGDCVHCGTPWERVEVDNIFAQFSYYRPACGCYPVCRRCGYQMIEEVDGGLARDKCPNCHEERR